MWKLDIYCESVAPLNSFEFSSRAELVETAHALRGMQWANIYRDGRLVGSKGPKRKHISWCKKQRRPLVTLRNDFHKTEINVRVPLDGILSKRQTRKVRSALCGMRDCSCGIVRGSQNGYHVEETPDRQIKITDMLSTAEREALDN